MSAIFGVYNLDGKSASALLLEEMSDILAHRGTDNKGIWCDGSVGLGHRMLWTTPESLDEKLPKSICDGNFVITADARIDNRDELLKEFNQSKYSSNDIISDSEIILLAYEKWGEECTVKLVGDFAFAIWDKRKRTIFCARDHFGVKPFYYYYSENLFVFGTEVKALLRVPEVPRVLNEVKVGDYLTGFYEDVSDSFYSDIYRLPASSQMTVNQTGKSIRTYWSLDPKSELRLSSDKEYAENFRELFTEAVRCRMRSAYPIGSMLSGGLDSSSIACTAHNLMAEASHQSRNGQSKLHTFSAVFEEVTKSDESFYINAVLKSGSYEPHFIKADQVSPMEDWENIIWHQDEAVLGSNLYITRNIYGKAQLNGVRIVLDGFDGDTTVSHGARYLMELAQSKQWRMLIRNVRGYAKNFDESAAALMWAFYWQYSLNPKLSKHQLLLPLRRLGQKIDRRARTKSKYPAQTLSDFADDLNPDFIEQIKLAEHQTALTKLRPRSPKTEREDHYIRFLSSTIPLILEIQNKASAPFGLEVRYPFWDKRLAEFCLSLPAEQKMHNGLSRMVMRRAMAGVLPEEVQWRPKKTDMSYGFRSGLEKFEYERLSHLLKTNLHLLEKYANIKVFTEKIESFSNGTASILDLVKITTLVSLALWLRSAKLD